MDRGTIPVNKKYELEYRYYDKDTSYKYFNRKFEVFLLEKHAMKKNYVMHMDNSDMTHMGPYYFKATPSGTPKRIDVGISTLNWNNIKNDLVGCMVAELGENERDNVKKAIGKLHSPKM